MTKAKEGPTPPHTHTLPRDTKFKGGSKREISSLYETPGMKQSVEGLALALQLASKKNMFILRQKHSRHQQCLQVAVPGRHHQRSHRTPPRKVLFPDSLFLSVRPLSTADGERSLARQKKKPRRSHCSTKLDQSQFPTQLGIHPL